jgi:hypothetical protein
MSTKNEVLNHHNGSPLETAMMDGDAVSEAVSAAAPLTRVVFPFDPVTALRNAAHNLDVARWRARECRDSVAASRQAFNLALSAWSATQPIQNVEDLKKEWIRSNQEDRRLRAEARQLQRPATITETAKAMSGGNRRPGGGASYKRGAFTRAEAARIEMNRMAAARMNGNIAPRVKLPSER